MGALPCVVQCCLFLDSDCSYILQGSGSETECKLYCFVKTKTLCRYGCMYLLAALVLVRVDVMVMSCVGHDWNWCSVWWYVCSVNVE